MLWDSLELLSSLRVDNPKQNKNDAIVVTSGTIFPSSAEHGREQGTFNLAWC